MNLLAKNALHGSRTTTVDDLEGVAHVMLALSAKNDGAVRRALKKAIAAGVELEDVGSVALYGDHARVGRVLAETFGVFPQHYRMLGQEYGVYCVPGYPTLAMAACFQLDELQDRALSWGADPNATWQVDRILTSYVSEPQTISWVGENIRFLNSTFLNRLLAVCKPASADEEIIRLRALFKPKNDSNSRDRFLKAREVTRFFSPGGAYPLSCTPWVVRDGALSLASSYVAAAIKRSQNENDVLFDWVASTLKPESEDVIECLEQCLEQSETLNLGGGYFPAWCVEALSPNQAEAFVKKAWEVFVTEWFNMFTTTNKLTGLRPIDECAPLAFAAYLKPLMEKIPGPVELDVRRLLGLASSGTVFHAMKMKNLVELIQAVPCDSETACASIKDVLKMVQAGDELRDEIARGPSTTDALRTQFVELGPKFDALQKRLSLDRLAHEAQALSADVKSSDVKMRF